jgi:deoxyribodipyrimidine photo-lyase
MWFRSDLRTLDNPALHQACAEATRGVVGVFVVCPGQWREHDWADVKVDFILRTLHKLSASLRTLKIPLLVTAVDRFRDVPDRLLEIAGTHDCDELFFNHEYEVNEAARDEAVTRALQAEGLGVRACHDQCVLSPGSLRTTTDSCYTVFTPFRKAWIDRLRQQGLPEVLGRPKPQPELVTNPDDLPCAVDGFDRSTSRPDLWPAGENVAQDRLETFIGNQVRAYTRQRDLPAEDATSRLSPHLTIGAISSRRCVQAAFRANHNRFNGRNHGAATWLTEIIWREFYRHFLTGFPRVSMNRPFRSRTDELPWRHDDEQFTAWCQGRTGVPIVDAGMRQLLETGWMHNRLRMITAMFLTKDLFIDWRWGERHFMRHLIDGDLASNNGGWQWSASTGADAVPYFRVFNPYRQGRRFDADGVFVRRYVPELAEVPTEAVHDPSLLPGRLRSGLDYPEPIVQHAQAAAEAVAAFRRLRETSTAAS